MEIMHDGIEIFCLPDTARCKAAGCDPFDLDECPRGMDVCEPGSCDCYTEEEFEKELKYGLNLPRNCEFLHLCDDGKLRVDPQENEPYCCDCIIELRGGK